MDDHGQARRGSVVTCTVSPSIPAVAQQVAVQGQKRKDVSLKMPTMAGNEPSAVSTDSCHPQGDAQRVAGCWVIPPPHSGSSLHDKHMRQVTKNSTVLETSVCASILSGG